MYNPVQITPQTPSPPSCHIEIIILIKFFSLVDAHPFTCSVCNKSFKQQNHLDRHKKQQLTVSHARPPTLYTGSHQNKIIYTNFLFCFCFLSDAHPFTCSICNKSLKQQNHLDRHKKTFSSTQPCTA